MAYLSFLPFFHFFFFYFSFFYFSFSFFDFLKFISKSRFIESPGHQSGSKLLIIFTGREREMEKLAGPRFVIFQKLLSVKRPIRSTP